MIDPILTLAFSMQSAPGLYALLVASGISRAAKIPTGWDITVDLIRRVAMLEKADCEPDPAAWHLSRLGHEPNYSELLQGLAKTSAERSQLLRRYFEPTDEERQRGDKLPTAAHHAIAELVAGGYVKVIISPNFDRLMEQALQAKGIEPTVVSSAAQAEGLGALSQIRCLVLKPHGDYLETGLKNTPDELRSFDPAMNVLLDRIFDDFGLIVSGWSAEYDHALVEAIERSKSRRYSIFWTTLGEPADRAKRLIAFRHATAVRILSADAFFRAVADNVVALEKYGTTHPLSIAAAVARLKEYLALPAQNRILIHELITEAGNQLCSVLAQYREPRNAHADGSVLYDEMTKLEKHSELLINLVVTGMWWGDDSQRPIWRSVFTRLVSQNDALPGYQRPINLKLYPALLATYAGGIACCGAGNYGLLYETLNGATVMFPDKRPVLGATLYPNVVVEKTAANLLPELERRHTPTSDYLCTQLRPLFKDLLPDDSEYEDCLDRFEYLFALNFAFHRVSAKRDPWAPVGRFGWRRQGRDGFAVYDLVGREAEAAQQDWPVLRAGFFAGDLTKFRELQKYFVETMMPAVVQQWW